MPEKQSSSVQFVSLVMIIVGGIFVFGSAIVLAIWQLAWASRPAGLWVPTGTVLGLGVYLVLGGIGMRKGFRGKRQPK